MPQPDQISHGGNISIISKNEMKRRVNTDGWPAQSHIQSNPSLIQHHSQEKL